MVFVHSRKETGKTGRILAEMAAAHGSRDLFIIQSGEVQLRAKKDVQKSRNREIVELFDAGINFCLFFDSFSSRHRNSPCWNVTFRQKSHGTLFFKRMDQSLVLYRHACLGRQSSRTYRHHQRNANLRFTTRKIYRRGNAGRSTNLWTCRTSSIRRLWRRHHHYDTQQTLRLLR